MNYDQAKREKDYLNHLSNMPLLVSQQWIIKDIVVLPRNEETRFVYASHISMYYPEWIATSFDHDHIYQRSGLYITPDGRQWNDDLTLFALTKKKDGNEQTTYRCHLLKNLINTQEVTIADIEGL